jgi:ubiquinone/menaquinone biosynthesis C-methylase UbiE
MESELYSTAKAALVRLGVKPGDRMLDFGAGFGNYAIPAADIIGDGGIVYALDKSEERLGQTRAYQHPQVKCILTDGSPKVPLPDGSVDVVFMSDVQLEGPQPYIAEFRRVLAPGGLFLAYLPVEEKRDLEDIDRFIEIFVSEYFDLTGTEDLPMVHWDHVEEGRIHILKPR